MIQQIAAVRRALLFFSFISIVMSGPATQAQIPVTNNPPYYGPYNAVFLPDGDGLTKSLVKDDTVLKADSPWSLFAWVRMEEQPSTITLVAGVGDPGEEYPRFLAYDGNKVSLWMGKDNSLSGAATLAKGTWHLIGATFDGSDFRLYSDGAQVAAGKLELGSVSPVLTMAPPMVPPPLPFSPFGPAASSEPPASFAPPHEPTLVWQHFGGKIAGLTLLRTALSAAEIKKLNDKPQDFSLALFEEGSKSWGVQTRGQAGYRAPQDPDTMPRSKAPFSKPVAVKPPSLPVLQETAKNEWTINGWMLQEAPKVTADAAQIAQTGFSEKNWMAATVPGTVLTTMIDRGVYPDPDYGLNNLAIPESLNKQDYWYRTEFKTPKLTNRQHLTLTFEGINYKADVWLNGQELGTITGAFIRGVFDVTNILKAEQTNVLAVRISPPPHPGIPQEQSIKGGPGENGGIMCLDGPTFVATEGWDWIPAIRDRNSGLWQKVVLTASGPVKIGDAQVVTSLPLPDTSKADVEITVPMENSSDAPVHGTLTASFDQTTVIKNVTVAPGGSTVKLTPAEFSQLTVQKPRLWWPNGYGKQELYTLTLSFAENGNASDTKRVRFGIREITYELSLFDETGHLRRVDFSPTKARVFNQRVVNVTHAGMIETPSKDPIPAGIPDQYKEYFKWWVASLMPGMESSAALKPGTDPDAAPYLVIKVNGVKIACRGGNWGMDDSRKRVSREKLEPYFRLHHDANLNIIRNWQGQNTEETFYDLADEYGMLVWNDFWEATENYNIEAEDPALFLKNARDVILRFRNHPSIVVWCGRNEGVPQPAINLGLDELTRTLDGTRYYSPSSNRVNLQGSGPYRYMDPQLYYTILNRGFSVETGTPSMSTLESFKAWIPEQDQWPVGDDWAYHDWHQSGNGEVAPFMAQVQSEFGAPTSLEDFERKVQMLNYVQHRAIFEGMNAHLWAPNSGRLLWMTQPAWPSTMWQILSSDYDTQASFYGTKKACEPVHVQLDLSNNDVDVVNTTIAAQPGLTVTANVYSLDNKLLLHREEKKDLAADAEANAFQLELAPYLKAGIVIVKLELRNAGGQLVSDNLYWLGGTNSQYRQLNHLAAAALTASASSTPTDSTVHVRVQLKNTGNDVALENKLTLLNTNGTRILPAYYSDNYVSLLPGESKEIDIEYPASAATGAAQIAIRGWNATPQKVAVQ
jgi:Glycosyl hydrolase 2 galactose-binding domain-like/Exo-beta-D-glucosaminidase Ig-fold domain/Glycosyl hydrolases family 2/Concanavalin A-like lectin/glucanases superfamily/Glycosyl hydrolases family 2, TIM barrel domain